MALLAYLLFVLLGFQLFGWIGAAVAFGLFLSHGFAWGVGFAKGSETFPEPELVELAEHEAHVAERAARQ